MLGEVRIFLTADPIDSSKFSGRKNLGGAINSVNLSVRPSFCLSVREDGDFYLRQLWVWNLAHLRNPGRRTIIFRPKVAQTMSYTETGRKCPYSRQSCHTKVKPVMLRLFSTQFSSLLLCFIIANKTKFTCSRTITSRVLPLYGRIARDIAAGARRRNYVCIYRREQKVTAVGSEASSPANASTCNMT